MVAGEESSEKEDTKIAVQGYKWFENPVGIKIVTEVRVGLAL